METETTRSFNALKKRSMDVNFDDVSPRYKLLEKIGSGAYGVVCSAIKKKSGDKVAIKKIPGVFDHILTAKRTFRELKILKHFNHDNIIGIKEILKSGGDGGQSSSKEFKDVFVVFDLMESDLHHIIHSKQPLSDEHVRYFTYQILRGLKFVHSANVIHRDLKPSNLLINEDCELKIGDFGMARGLSSGPEEVKKIYMTSYVATRWYRSPELLIGSDSYTQSVDIWSVGCILAEMMARKQLFPGKNMIDQLDMVTNFLGSPSPKFLALTRSDQVKNFISRKFENRRPVSLRDKFVGASPQGIDLLAKMLVFDADERISAAEALSHPYLSKYHDADDEPICIPTFNFDFEKQEMSEEDIREAIHGLIEEYQKPRGAFRALLQPVSKATADSGTDLYGAISANGMAPLTGVVEPGQTPTTASKSKKLSPAPVTVTHSSDDVVMKSAQPSAPPGDKSIFDQLGASAATLNDIVMKSATGEGPDKKTTESLETGAKCDKGGDHSTEEAKPLDTKALIKAALLSQMRKNPGDKSGHKPPVTALQRQREREEKKRQKLKRQRQKEKQKKVGEQSDKQKVKLLLSDDDRHLLVRWKNMQEPWLTSTGQPTPAPSEQVPPPMAIANGTLKNPVPGAHHLPPGQNPMAGQFNPVLGQFDPSLPHLIPAMSETHQAGVAAAHHPRSQANNDHLLLSDKAPLLSSAAALPPGGGRQSAQPPVVATAVLSPNIAMVTAQLSRSVMDDPLPPVLMSTPKGDGTGYGIDLEIQDLDLFNMRQEGSKESALKCDSAPLSASLIADWLDVRNLNQDEMIALQKEVGIESPATLGHPIKK